MQHITYATGDAKLIKTATHIAMQDKTTSSPVTGAAQVVVARYDVRRRASEVLLNKSLKRCVARGARARDWVVIFWERVAHCGGNLARPPSAQLVRAGQHSCFTCLFKRSAYKLAWLAG